MVYALKEGGRGGSPGKERHVARNALVVAQMAMALILLAGSGLMIRSFQALLAVEPGFTAPEEVLTFRMTIPTAEVEGQREMAMVDLRGLVEFPNQIRVRGKLGQLNQRLGDLGLAVPVGGQCPLHSGNDAGRPPYAAVRIY